VFQSYALFPHLNVIENVCYGLHTSPLGKQQVRDKARAMLDTVGLQGLDQRRPHELSGGQQQRVALARALALEPAVLLFDEPLSNLDARLRRSMREEIRTLQQRLKLTVAYVTHDQSEALAVSDQIVVMHQGTIAQRGAPRALYEQPASEFVAGFMGEAMLFEGHQHAPDPASTAGASYAQLGLGHRASHFGRAGGAGDSAHLPGRRHGIHLRQRAGRHLRGLARGAVTAGCGRPGQPDPGRPRCLRGGPVRRSAIPPFLFCSLSLSQCYPHALHRCDF
jgi:ABC-type Fe3+/spermidine/putrescine transport system ATPase subunit